MDKNIAEVSLYDINKSMVAQITPLSVDDIQKKKIELRNFINRTKNKFYMLLCRDINYYTLFEKQSLVTIKDIIEDVIIECANNFGTIHSIELTDDGGGYEIWIKDKETGEGCLFMFFPYDLGVIKCR